jgi:hypothetical protein
MPSDQITGDTTFGLNWTAIAAQGIRPGLAVGMDGSYHHCEDKAADPTQPTAACLDSYQLFLKLSMSWMPTY